MLALLNLCWCDRGSKEGSEVFPPCGIHLIICCTCCTGEHPTTRLCLREIFAQKDFSGKYIIDYGTGSGVLALTALKLGKSHICYQLDKYFDLLPLNE